MNVQRAPSCDDPFDALMPVAQARQRMLDRLVVPQRPKEHVVLEQAAGRVLGDDIVATLDVPPAANSAMDGYAIAASSIPSEGEARLEVVGTAWAGRPWQGTLAAGQAVRIFTGATLPEGADTVVIQEHVGDEQHADRRYALIDAGVQPRRHVRAAGEDVAAGERVFAAGRRLGAADLGVLASLGIARVPVRARLRVAVFTTGDELVSLADSAIADDGCAGEPGPGLLYDSNRFTLRALLARLDVELIDLGIVPDDPDATRAAFADAGARADLVISSGGISTGDADHVRSVFHELGEVGFWRLAMRPGRPLAFGRLADATFFGLPGNPVAVMVTFLQFVQPALRLLAGENPVTVPPVLAARSLSRMRKSLGRTEYQRGVAALDDAGVLTVTTTGPQGAGRLSSMAAANCLVVIAPDVPGVEPGDTVGVQLLHGLLA